jgi:lysophospholipase L1-like esterase
LITWEIEDETIEEIVSNAKKYEDHYKTRLKELVQITRDLGAEIVLVTQPVLYGKGIDDQTGLDLSRIYVEGVDGATAWHILESYNDVTRSVSREYNVHLIDLAMLMPKSSLYFYDTIHLTNEGAERVSEILYEGLCSYMADRFPSEIRNKCQPAVALK